MIKGVSVKQRADKISDLLINILNQEDEEKLQNFAKKYNLDTKILQNSKDYFSDSKGDTIYKWCLKFGK